jgi:hypothetical protein
MRMRGLIKTLGSEAPRNASRTSISVQVQNMHICDNEWRFTLTISEKMIHSHWIKSNLIKFFYINSIVFYSVRSDSKMFDPILPHSPEFWLGVMRSMLQLLKTEKAGGREGYTVH